MRYLSRKFKVPIYNYRIVVVITDDLNAYCEEVMKTDKDEYKDVAGLVCTEEDSTPKQLNKCDCKVIFQTEKDKDTLSGYISHEAFHVLKDICKTRGFGVFEEGEEAGAYLLQYLVEKFNKIYEALWQNLTSPSTTPS